MLFSSHCSMFIILCNFFIIPGDIFVSDLASSFLIRIPLPIHINLMLLCRICIQYLRVSMDPRVHSVRPGFLSPHSASHARLQVTTLMQFFSFQYALLLHLEFRIIMFRENVIIFLLCHTFPSYTLIQFAPSIRLLHYFAHFSKNFFIVSLTYLKIISKSEGCTAEAFIVREDTYR